MMIFVNELLQDGGVEKSETADEETGVHAFGRHVIDTNRP